jgi:hypothetical protein
MTTENRFSNSAWAKGMTANPQTDAVSPFQLGVVEDIDPERWVANVFLLQLHQRQKDIPIMSPYFNWETGQGVYNIPEIGSHCMVGRSTAGYFILGFMPIVDKSYIEAGREKKPSQNFSMEFTKEAKRALRNAPSEAASGVRKLSFRCKREDDMLPGDYCVKTRAFNKIKLFTDGNILCEASKLCFRIYSYLKNWIMDTCVNYLLKTPGGEHRWSNDDETDQSDFKREYKQKVTDNFASVTERIGNDAAPYQFIVSNKDSRKVVDEDFEDITSKQAFVPEVYRIAVDNNGSVMWSIDHNHEVSSGNVTFGYYTSENTWIIMKGYTSKPAGTAVGDGHTEYAHYVDGDGRTGRIVNVTGAVDSQYEELISPNGDLSEKSKGKMLSEFSGDVWLKSGTKFWISGQTEVHLNPPTPEIDTVIDELVAVDPALENLAADGIEAAASVKAAILDGVSSMTGSAISALASNVPSPSAIMGSISNAATTMGNLGALSSAGTSLINSATSAMSPTGQLALAEASVKDAVLSSMQSMDASSFMQSAMAGVPGIPSVGATVADLKGKVSALINNAISKVDVGSLLPPLPIPATPKFVGDIKKLTNPLDAIGGMGMKSLTNMTKGLGGRIAGKVKGTIL